MHSIVMLTTPVAPLLLALALIVAPGARILQRAAVLAPVPALLICLLMPPGIGATLPWLLEGSELGLDPIARIFLFFSSAIWLAAALSASVFIPGAGRGRFLVFFLLAMSGNLGTLIARDMLAFYLFFSLMSFAAYGLVVHGGGAEARRAGAWYLALVVAGDMMLYAGLVTAALDAGGTVLLGEVREAITESPHRDMIIALTFAGFGVKAGAIGLHVTLPMIYRVAPLPAGAAFAGAMLHAGLLGWLRFLPIGADVPGWGRALLAAGVAGTLYGALVGSVQRDPRSVLAYSSISQIGIMLGGVGAALLAPRYAAGIAFALAIYALHHAFVKSALFLGLLVASREPRGRAALLVLRAGLLLPALALAGVPLTSGSLAKEYLKEELAAADAGPAVLFAAALPWTAVLTTFVAARFLWLAWPLTWRLERPLARPLERPRARHLGPADGAPVKTGPTSAEWTAFTSMLLLVLIGAWLQPIVRLPALWSLPVVWELTWPAASGAVIAGLAARAIVTGRLPRAPALPPGDIAIPIERVVRRAAAGWQRIAFDSLPSARNAVRDASTAAFADRRWSASLEAIERVLVRWGTATAAFVLISIVLALLLLLASGSARGN